MQFKFYYTVPLLLLLAACSDAEPLHEIQPTPRPVQLHTVGSELDSNIRRFPAVVEATQTANLTFRVGGEIKELPWRPGQELKQGELIAALDPRDYQLTVDQAAARAELAEAQFRRMNQLREDNLVSPAQFDEAKAELEVARANLNTARTNLDYTRLKAPFDGIVANLHVELFENVAPQQPVVTLHVDDMVDVSIQVPERLFAQVRRDLNYRPDISFDSMPGHTFKGQIREWDRIADPATNTYRVVFSLPRPENGNILPGMTATVMIDASQVLPQPEGAVRVPVSAVFVPADQQLADADRYVWVYQPDADGSGLVEKRKILISTASSSDIMVIDGLDVGEQVVTAGVHQLKDGQRVRPWARERGL